MYGQRETVILTTKRGHTEILTNTKTETSCQQIDAVNPVKTNLVSCRQSGNHLHGDIHAGRHQGRLD